MFDTTAAFFKSMLLPLFKVGLVIFLIVVCIIGSVILWQKIRERKEYRAYLQTIKQDEI